MLSEEAIAHHAALAGAVTVKPLVWEGDGHWRAGDCEGWLEEANTPFGWGYAIEFGNSIEYPWIVSSTFGESLIGFDGPEFDSPEGAKAAAQADYDARILAALEPDHNAERIELARQNAALREQVASLTADNEALQRTVAKMCAAVNEITDPETIWCAIDGVHDFDASLNDYAAAVSKAQRAEWEASK